MALTTASHTQISTVLTTLNNQRLSIPTFIISILRHSSFIGHSAVEDLVCHSNDIFNAFLDHPRTSDSILAWANGKIKLKYAQHIRDLADKDNGWHFSATNTSAKQLLQFRIEDMAAQMKRLAPDLWDLVLLSASHQSDADIESAEDAMDLDSRPAENLSARAQKLAARREALIVISSNNKCNALESVFGIFLHASNTPYKVIETLAHMGITISVDAIENAVRSLSRETAQTLRAMGQTFLSEYAYDNFDINFPGLVPVVEKSTDTLTHLTSGGLILLEHGVTAEHLRCSQELWLKNPLNPSIDPGTLHPPRTILDLEQHLENLHPEIAHPSNLTYLGTGERIASILERRSIEATPWRRYQYIVFVMGLFHLKMAAADAIWRIFIEPKMGRDDTTSLMHFVALLRPKETGKISSDPGFRRMHEVVAHVGAALRLDAWRIEVLRRNSKWTSLQAFAESKPSFDLVTEISQYLASHCVAGAEDMNIFELRQKPSAERDQQHENILQMHQYFNLYEELSFAMNFGDIGRIETLFPTWIYIFKAVGKHKYAAHMLKFMNDVHFEYPPPLRHAVRYNILPNPTGTEGKSRAVDWVVEQMINLPTKDTYGGRGSNYTKKRVLEESPLIHIYSQCIENITKNFALASLTTQQGVPDIARTLEKCTQYMKDHNANQRCAGRKTTYIIPDILDQGQNRMLSDKFGHEQVANEGTEGDEYRNSAINPEDLLID
ncbi:hypothetical protein R3P38DRAFT_3452552 [Favolaschia claudopus]|uniref:DUF6589 domain-containing protein n=1 Tax=Favolaschia claudopus TaxID=2862362 RepID=A0AAV9ZJM5_9AGAR